MSRPETSCPRFINLITGHFRSSKGYQAWRTNGTTDWLLIYTVGGKGRFGFRGGEIITGPGDMVLLRPGTLHDYGVENSVQRWELLWTHFHPRPEWIQWLAWPEEASGLMRLSVRDTDMRRLLKSRFGDIHTLATGPLRQRDNFAMNALEELLLWCDTINPKSEQAQLDPRVRQALDFICRNLNERLTLHQLGKISRLSVSRFAHLFREQVGGTPQRFIEVQRLDRAKQLLELTSMSVKEIAYQVGFKNPFYFTLRFKRCTGLSPRAFRRRAPQA